MDHSAPGSLSSHPLMVHNMSVDVKKTTTFLFKQLGMFYNGFVFLLSGV